MQISTLRKLRSQSCSWTNASLQIVSCLVYRFECESTRQVVPFIWLFCFWELQIDLDVPKFILPKSLHSLRRRIWRAKHAIIHPWTSKRRKMWILSAIFRPHSHLKKSTFISSSYPHLTILKPKGHPDNISFMCTQLFIGKWVKWERKGKGQDIFQAL